MPNETPVDYGTWYVLPWFKLHVATWRKHSAPIPGPAQGAFLTLCLIAWEQPAAWGGPPCALRADELRDLAAMRDEDWKRYRRALTAAFPPHPTAAGYVQPEWLVAEWQTSQRAYAGTIEKAKKGGTAPGAKRGPKPKRTNTPANSPAVSPANTSANSTANNGNSPAISPANTKVYGDYVPNSFQELGDIDPAAGAAAAGAAPEGALAASAGAESRNGNGHHHDPDALRRALRPRASRGLGSRARISARPATRRPRSSVVRVERPAPAAHP